MLIFNENTRKFSVCHLNKMRVSINKKGVESL